VLFRGDSSLSPETLIEMVLTLGAEIAANSAGTLVCVGRVVRIEAASENDPRAAIAASIACRQSYPQDSDPRRI
jgi:hypothetical protein